MSDRLLAVTESVCPVCLRTVAAQRVATGDDVYLHKRCPEHGAFKTIVWRGLETYFQWGERGSRAAAPPVTETPVERGCPHDCGICPEHRQHSCCVLLEVTQRCNLRCPVCFASAEREDSDPDIAEIEAWLRLLQRHGSPVNIQLSGGEPTVRDDLPEIVARCRMLGFDFVQLNTNGLRLAKEAGYAKQLADAGLDCVFLQFDGVSDGVYRRIRGANLLAVKKTAIMRCADAGLGVVLVPTLVPGVNVGEIGNILAFALARVPAVRAVHFQPVSYFGRYPAAPADRDRITLPEVMRELERQTDGMVQASDFAPGSAENAYCSFSGKFFVGGNGRLHAAAAPGGGCGDSSSGCGCGLPAADDAAQRARRVVAGQWAAEAAEAASPDTPGIGIASFEAFLANHRHSFSISGMAFQDAWNLDLERLRECFIHVVSPDRRVIPFCAYNLTSASGEPLYRRPHHECALA
ncbi:MAG: radical SAM protein [Rhodocyclales bacterium]|nr:radical SAM protein [Rhodocyclales bacterium]